MKFPAKRYRSYYSPNYGVSVPRWLDFSRTLLFTSCFFFHSPSRNLTEKRKLCLSPKQVAGKFIDTIYHLILPSWPSFPPLASLLSFVQMGIRSNSGWKILSFARFQSSSVIRFSRYLFFTNTYKNGLMITICLCSYTYFIPLNFPPFESIALYLHFCN